MATSQHTVEVLLKPGDRTAALAADAREGLTSQPKRLSPVWFYDDCGSMLFDEITRLEEYYLTRAERCLLAAHATEIAAVTGADTLVELGSGTSDKTRILLDALSAGGTLKRYAPLDVSEETLRSAASDLAGDYSGLEVHGVVGDFHRHLGALPAGRRRLIAFLGSTIGNLAPDERARFLFDLDCTLSADDHILLGVDLVKDPARLIAAYDDPGGVTASFNRNALRVVNAELGANFDPDRFDHLAVWNGDEHRIEMRLRSTSDQLVHVGGLGLDITFAEGEEMRTEISTKFTSRGIAAELERAGMVVEREWDAHGEFLLVLARPYC